MPTHPKNNPLISVGLLLASIVACGGGGGGGGSSSLPPAVSVSLLPDHSGLSTGGSLQLTATVANASNPAVSWTIEEGWIGGSIDGSGLFTAPLAVNGASADLHVVATAVADATKSARATLTITARPYQGVWSPGPPPTVVRATGHSLTLLKDGRVLLAGGTLSPDASSITSACEIYDPVANAWVATGSLSKPRSTHTATLLSNGRVVVAGGFIPLPGPGNEAMTDYTAELFDPASGTWTPTGSMYQMRQGAQASLLPNGKVLVVGGDGSGYSETFDPSLGTWSFAGFLGHPWTLSHSVMVLPGGRVVIAGGESNLLTLSDAMLYSASSNALTPTGPMTVAREGLQGVGLPSGKALACGGRLHTGLVYSPWMTAELFDPLTLNWTSTGSMLFPHTGAQGSLLSDGRFLLSGGMDGTGGATEIYDPQTGRWTVTGSTAGPRFNGQSVLLKDGRVMVGGGYSAPVFTEFFH